MRIYQGPIIGQYLSIAKRSFPEGKNGERIMLRPLYNSYSLIVLSGTLDICLLILSYSIRPSSCHHVSGYYIIIYKII